MKYTRYIAGAGVVMAACTAALVFAPKAHSADHLDSAAAVAEPTADINDLYSWVDGSNFIAAMTVSPNAPSTAQFSDAVQYAFHLTSGAGFGTSANPLDVICTFDVTQKLQCWAGTNEYVTGDASASAGITSKSGKFKVFAGRRADPFFFNLEGFKNTVATVKGAVGLVPDVAGCPGVDGATSAALVKQLQGTANGTAPAADFFKNFNTLAIVVSLDKSLVNKGGAIVSISASTHKK